MKLVSSWKIFLLCLFLFLATTAVAHGPNMPPDPWQCFNPWVFCLPWIFCSPPC
jgi:hypothetical protein